MKILIKIFDWDGINFTIHIEGSLARVPGWTILNWKNDSRFDIVYPIEVSSSFIEETNEILAQEEQFLNYMADEI